MSKLLTVFGATGNQGGSVVKTVLAHPELSKTYKVRAVTRDPSKANAQELQKLGAEVVKGDQNDLESLKAAIKGSDAVFAVTQFWESMDGAKEEAQGKAMADAAVAEGVKHFIFSSLPSPSQVSNGQLTHITHFEHKANVEAYIKTLPIKSAFFFAGFFMSNFNMFPPQKNEDGSFTIADIAPPSGKVPLLATARDTGKFIVPLLLHPDDWQHKRIYGATAYYSQQEIVDTFSRLLGKTVKFSQVPEKVFEGFLPPPIAKEMTENAILIRDYGYFGPDTQGAEAGLKESVKAVEAAGQTLTTFEEFVKTTEWTWAA